MGILLLHQDFSVAGQECRRNGKRYFGMTSLAKVLGNRKVWIPALALLVSVISVFLSWRSSRIARRAISESQEKRCQPQLGICLANGYRQNGPHGQLFGFLVSVTNPTDINNSIARAELQISYLLEKDVKTTCRLQHNPAVGESSSRNSAALVRARLCCLLAVRRYYSHRLMPLRA